MSVGDIDAKALLQNAEMSGQVYPMKKGWQRSQIFAGVLCCILIITIPLGIWIIVRARNAKAGLTREGFAFRYLTTVAFHWSDLESVTLSNIGGSAFGGGLVGAGVAAAVRKKTGGLKGPMSIKLRDRKRPVIVPAHTIQNSLEMAREMERLSGVSFLPEEGRAE